MTGPYEASFRDAAEASLAYWDAAHSEGPESQAAQNAQVAAEITSAAAERWLYREPGEPEAEAGQ